MAEKHLHRTLDAQQKIKNDHELFLEAYESKNECKDKVKNRILDKTSGIDYGNCNCVRH